MKVTLIIIALMLALCGCIELQTTSGDQALMHGEVPSIGSSINEVCHTFARDFSRDSKYVQDGMVIRTMHFPTGRFVEKYGGRRREDVVLTFVNGKLYSWMIF